MAVEVTVGAVAVITAVRNGLPHVIETVQSVLSQGDVLARMIVVDDGSTDGTVESLRAAFSDSRLEMLTNAGGGVSSARNLGAAQADAPWLLFLDADDRLAPGALATLMSARRPDAVLVYGDYERIDEDGHAFGRRHLARKRRRKPSGRVLEDMLGSNLFINGGGLVCEREAFLRSGGFDPRLTIAEDWHLWCRMAAIGPVYYTPRHVLDYRVHSASVMMRSRRRFDDFLPALQAIFDDPLITRGVGADRITELRRRADTVSMTYCAQQAVRARDYLGGAALALAAVRRYPMRTPWVIGRLAGAMARM